MRDRTRLNGLALEVFESLDHHDDLNRYFGENFDLALKVQNLQEEISRLRELVSKYESDE